MPRLIATLAALSMGLSSVAFGQVAVDQPSSSEEEPSPTNDRLLDLLGGIGVPTTDPANGADTPKPTARVKDNVRRCFDDARKRDVALSGRVEIEITLAEGKVKRGKLVESLSYELVLRECLTEAVQGAEVPDASIDTFTWLFIPSGAN